MLKNYNLLKKCAVLLAFCLQTFKKLFTKVDFLTCITFENKTIQFYFAFK
jgi:hypothetical protein